MKLIKSTAGRDEVCAGCGYLFDEGDWVWRYENEDGPYCSKACSKDTKKEE